MTSRPHTHRNAAIRNATDSPQAERLARRFRRRETRSSASRLHIVLQASQEPGPHQHPISKRGCYGWTKASNTNTNKNNNNTNANNNNNTNINLWDIHPLVLGNNFVCAPPIKQLPTPKNLVPQMIKIYRILRIPPKKIKVIIYNHLDTLNFPEKVWIKNPSISADSP